MPGRLARKRANQAERGERRVPAGLESLARNRTIRRVLLPIASRFNPGDISIRHHWTNEPLLIHSFKHKGYWFKGKRREQTTMELLRRVVQPGFRTADVGGHVGYITMFLSHLVGPGGSVEVFEPGPNNLPYLRANVGRRPNVSIREEAVGAHRGEATLFVEDLTGQNNSLGAVYSDLAINEGLAHVKAHVTELQVPVVTLDDVRREAGAKLDLIKIDIEGGELNALRGAEWVLAEDRPMIMVEVTDDQGHVVELLRRHGYELYSPAGQKLELDQLSLNVFAFHSTEHQHIIRGLSAS